MTRPPVRALARSLALAAATLPLAAAGPAGGHAGAVKPAVAVFAGGCFWGVEAVFEHVAGVTDVVSGFAGGDASTAHYMSVGSGRTGHAESVRVTYDPAKVTYEQLLHVFFTVAHDPTQLDRQGPDVGPQYRSVVFYATEAQHRAAEAYIAELTRTKAFPKPIVTELVPLRGFYEAEAYHQDYAAKHPRDRYIVVNDAPKVARLRQQFPDLYRERGH